MIKIKFKTKTWCLLQEGGGFDGHYNTKAILIKPEIFEVKEIVTHNENYANIWVYSDGCCDGLNKFLINVPNDLFNIVLE